jgi:hypothetical protein
MFYSVEKRTTCRSGSLVRRSTTVAANFAIEIQPAFTDVFSEVCASSARPETPHPYPRINSGLLYAFRANAGPLYLRFAA